jgi:cyanate permease
MVALFGIGAPLLSIGGPKVISECFSGKERGAAVGIYLASVRVGGMFALAATNSVVMPLTGFNWRLSFVCYGFFTLGAGLLWWFTVKDTSAEMIKENIPNAQVLLRLMKIRTVNILIIAGLFDFALVHGFTNWLPRILEVRGMLPKVAGIAAAVPLLVSIPSIILIPKNIPAHSRGRSLAVLAVLASVAFIMVTLPAVPSFVGLLLFGVTGPALLPLMVLILMDVPEIGTAYMGSVVGIYFCACEIGGIIGPFLMGFFFDLFKNFLVGACFLAILGLIIAAMTFPLKMQK